MRAFLVVLIAMSCVACSKADVNKTTSDLKAATTSPEVKKLGADIKVAAKHTGAELKKDADKAKIEISKAGGKAKVELAKAGDKAKEKAHEATSSDKSSDKNS